VRHFGRNPVKTGKKPPTLQVTMRRTCLRKLLSVSRQLEARVFAIVHSRVAGVGVDKWMSNLIFITTSARVSKDGKVLVTVRSK
jgi:hypothetical protein